MSLDIDGILHVTAIEKETGKSKQITIARALQEKSPAEIAAARERLKVLCSRHSAMGSDNEEKFASDDADDASEPVASEPADNGVSDLPQALLMVKEASDLVEKSQRLLGGLHEEDREEAIDLHEKINSAIRSNEPAALKRATAELRELLFFVEGR